jgi:hypothetical protein
MDNIIVTGASEISYEILKDYHSTAQAIYERRKKLNQDLSIEYLFELDIAATSLEEAKEIFLSYAHKLNDLGVALHIGHLVFITQAIRDFEGSYIIDVAPLNETILPELESLQRLLRIQASGDFRHMQLEFTSSRFANREFDSYTRIKDPDVYEKILSATIIALFEQVKSRSHLYSFDIANMLSKIEGLPSIQDIDNLLIKASSVTAKSFNGQLLYTISSTLLEYLNDHSPLNPEKVTMTNDSLRVIYHTLQIHNLLTASHDLERDALNYIRMLITNRRNEATMLGRLVGEL